MSNVILLDKGAVQTDRARPPTKSTVTNLCPSSFTNTTSRWFDSGNASDTASNAFCVDDGAVIPLEKLVDTGAGGTGSLIVRYEHNAASQDPDFNDLTGSNMILSFYVRADQLSFVVARTSRNTTNDWNGFDLSTGAKVLTDADTTSYITEVVGGYRIEIVYPWVTDSDNRHFYYIYASNDGASANPTVDLDTTSSLLLGGFQLENTDNDRAGSLAYNKNTTGNLEYTQTFGGNVLYLNKGAVQPTRTPSAVLSGTIIGQSESEIVDGGKDVVLTLDGATWQKPARQNWALKSEDFSVSPWNYSQLLPFGAGSVVDDAVAPDGTMTADLLVPTAVNSNSHYARQTIAGMSAELNAGDPITASVYVKDAGYDTVSLRLISSDAPLADFDLTAVTTDFPDNATIVLDEQGFYRITLTGLYTSGAPLFYVYPGGNPTFTGDGVSGVLVWGAQVETGLEATDYIATAASTVIFSGFTDAIRQAIIDGLDSDGVEAGGWDAVVKAGLVPANVVRTSDQVVTVTLPAFAGYDIDGDETITATIPIAALNNGIATIAAPTFDIAATVADLGAIYTAQAALSGGTNRQAAISGGSNRRGALTGGTNRRGSLN